jgi:hypothetical protein
MQDNAIAAFHRDVYREWNVETKLWKLHTFIVNDTAGIKHVLVDNGDNYIKGNIEQRISGALAGNRLSTKEDWRERRRTMSSSFDYRSILNNSSNHSRLHASSPRAMERPAERSGHRSSFGDGPVDAGDHLAHSLFLGQRRARTDHGAHLRASA